MILRLDLDQVQIVIIALAKLAEMDQRKMADAGCRPHVTWRRWPNRSSIKLPCPNGSKSK
jgi:hypothetical protein